MFILITGGSGSGKSEYAEDLAVSLSKRFNTEKLYYIAAMKPYGTEGAKRVEKHRAQRAGKGFATIENYTAAMPDISKDSVVLLECLSNLTANEVFDENNQNAAEDIFNFAAELSHSCKALVIVTNEIF
ncbi:MAG: bifunctional adenosylcobinamide kinase/adenosylcobinamide-phosphate guanylyltransferase, partial [Firmicutes bacterium]|nr:bifunctional adenosylcobinamide kinase/adenosylcobinamide-phosphate guanylyltransferase [Bacillota bacterium]